MVFSGISHFAGYSITENNVRQAPRGKTGNFQGMSDEYLL